MSVGAPIRLTVTAQYGLLRTAIDEFRTQNLAAVTSTFLSNPRNPPNKDHTAEYVADGAIMLGLGLAGIAAPFAIAGEAAALVGTLGLLQSLLGGVSSIITMGGDTLMPANGVPDPVMVTAIDVRPSIRPGPI